jgi:hypothetical protein
MDIMRKAMAAIHMARMMMDPRTDQAKHADKMYRDGSKFWEPDLDALKGGASGGPPMAGGPGGPPGGGPPMAGGGMPGAAPNRGPIPMQQQMAGAGP